MGMVLCVASCFWGISDRYEGEVVWGLIRLLRVENNDEGTFPVQIVLFFFCIRPVVVIPCKQTNA